MQSGTSVLTLFLSLSKWSCNLLVVAGPVARGLCGSSFLRSAPPGFSEESARISSLVCSPWQQPSRRCSAVGCSVPPLRQHQEPTPGDTLAGPPSPRNLYPKFSTDRGGSDSSLISVDVQFSLLEEEAVEDGTHSEPGYPYSVTPSCFILPADPQFELLFAASADEGSSASLFSV